MSTFHISNAEDGKKTGDGTSVGFFIPLPVNLAKQFPKLGVNDKSPPHITFLYVGNVSKDREEDLLEIATSVFSRVNSVTAHMDDLEYLVHPDKGRRVAIVQYKFSRDLAALRWKLRDALMDADFRVEDSFPLVYRPHTTLEYIEGYDRGYEKEVPTGSWTFDSIEVWGLPQLMTVSFGDSQVSKLANRYLNRVSFEDTSDDFERVAIGLSLILAQNVIVTNPYFNRGEIQKYLRTRVAFHPEFAASCEVVADVLDGTPYHLVSPALRRVSRLGPKQFQQSLVQVLKAFKELGRIQFADIDDRKLFILLRVGSRISRLLGTNVEDQDYYRAGDEFKDLAEDLIRLRTTPPQLKTLFRKLLKLGISSVGSVFSPDADPGAWFSMSPEEKGSLTTRLQEVKERQKKILDLQDPDERYQAYQKALAEVKEIQVLAGVNENIIESRDEEPIEMVLKKERKQQRDAPTDFVVTSFIKEVEAARKRYPDQNTRLTDREWQKLRTILLKVTTFSTLQRVVAEAVDRRLLKDYDLEGIRAQIQAAQKNLALKEGVPLAPMTWAPATEEEVRERHGVGQIRFDPAYTEKQKQEVLGRVDRAISDLEIVFGKGFCGKHAKRLNFKFEESQEGLTLASYFAWGNAGNNWQPQVKFGPEFEGVLAHELSHFLDDMLAFQIEKSTNPEMPAYSYGDVTHGIGTLFVNTGVSLEYILQNFFNSTTWGPRLDEFPEVKEFAQTVVASPAYQNWKDYLGNALQATLPEAFQKVTGQSLFDDNNRQYADAKWKSDLPPGVVEEAERLYRELMGGDVRKLTYLESGIEVWARMCEQYVYTKLARVGITNPWLTQMSYEGDSRFMDQDYFDKNLLPVMDRLFKRLKERQILARRRKQAMTDRASRELMMFLSKAARNLGVAQHVYVVGGAVRNFVLKQPIKDIDVVIDSVALGGKDADWFAKKLREVIPVETSHVTNQYGVAILTVKGNWEVGGVNLKGEDIEIANARSESYSEGGYKPSEVAPATIQEDIYRRELTFNTLLWRLLDLADGPDKAEIIDLTGCGLKDLQEGVAKCPRDPDIVFNDDASRMVRAIKFLLKYNLRISPDVEASIRRNKDKLWNVPPSHLSKLLIGTFFEAGIGKQALLEMKRLGLLEVVHEIAQKDKAFRQALAHWADRDASLEFFFDLMDLGMPTGRRLSGFSSAEKERIREITIQMTPDEADTFIEVMEQPGKILNMPTLIMEYVLKGPDIRRIQDAVKEAVLKTPALATNADRLLAAVRERLGGSRREAGIFEGPPAMTEAITAWMRSVIAGQALANVDKMLARIGDRSGPLQEAITVLENALLELRNTVQALSPGEEYRLDSQPPGARKWVLGIRSDQYARNYYSFSAGEQRHLTYQLGKGGDIELVLKWAGQEIRDQLRYLRLLLTQGKYRASDSEIVDLHLLRAEALRYTGTAKSYTSKTSRKFPLDLTDWKYIRENSPLIQTVNKQIAEKNQNILQAIETGKHELAQAQDFYDRAKRGEDVGKDIWRSGYNAQTWYPQMILNAIAEGKRPAEALARVQGTLYSPEDAKKLLAEPLKPGEVNKAFQMQWGWEEGITATLFFTSHKKRGGQWNLAYREIQVDAGSTSFIDSVRDFQDTMFWVEQTIRHEVQHLGQDLLRLVEELKEDAGLPSHNLRDLAYNPSGYKGRGKGRNLHPLRDTEFYTDLADAVDDFLRGLQRVPRKDYAAYFRTFVAMPVREETQWNKSNPHFYIWRTKAPDKWKKAVAELLKAAASRGFRLPAGEVKVAKTFTLNEGDPILYGKYKNKPGIIKDFGVDEKSGDPTVTIEPDPKGRKDDKEIKLFKIRERKQGSSLPFAPGTDKRGKPLSPGDYVQIRGRDGWVGVSDRVQQFYFDEKTNTSGMAPALMIVTTDWSGAILISSHVPSAILRMPTYKEPPADIAAVLKKYGVGAVSRVARRFMFADDTIQVIDFVRGYKQITGVRRIPVARNVDPRTKQEQIIIGNDEIDRLGIRIPGKEYLSDAETEKLFKGEVVIEEKVDGRSCVVLYGGYTFFAESLRLQHTVAYDNVPYSQVGWPDMTVVYEIMEGETPPPYRKGQGNGKWLSRSEKEAICNMVGAPLVPLVFKGHLTPEKLPALADRISSFGSSQAEGVVIKNLGTGVFGKFINLEFQKAISDESTWGGVHPELRGLRNIRKPKTAGINPDYEKLTIEDTNGSAIGTFVVPKKSVPYILDEEVLREKVAAKYLDRLPGGLADKRKPSDFDPKKLEKGISVEMEHTNDRAVAREVAMDHLTEDPDYYTKLEQIEKVAARWLIAKAKALMVFDFDATLVTSEGSITVIRPGGERVTMSNTAFTYYKSSPGEELDFGAFNDVTDPRPIKGNLEKLRKASKEAIAVILTARPKGSASSVEKFLSTQGIEGIKVIALASSDPFDKARWISKVVEEEGIEEMEFFDDSPRNAAAVKSFAGKHPKVKWSSDPVPYPKEQDYAGPQIKKTFKSDNPTVSRVKIPHPEGQEKAPVKGPSEWWQGQTPEFQRHYCQEHERSQYCHTASSGNSFRIKEITDRARQTGNRRVQEAAKVLVGKIQQMGHAAGIWLESLERTWGQVKAEDAFEGMSKGDLKTLGEILFSKGSGGGGGKTASQDQIKALEALGQKAQGDAWLARFIPSVISQLKGGRSLSEKQLAVIQKNLKRYGLPQSVDLFEVAVRLPAPPAVPPPPEPEPDLDALFARAKRLPALGEPKVWVDGDEFWIAMHAFRNYSARTSIDFVTHDAASSIGAYKSGYHFVVSKENVKSAKNLKKVLDRAEDLGEEDIKKQQEGLKHFQGRSLKWPTLGFTLKIEARGFETSQPIIKLAPNVVPELWVNVVEGDSSDWRITGLTGPIWGQHRNPNVESTLDKLDKQEEQFKEARQIVAQRPNGWVNSGANLKYDKYHKDWLLSIPDGELRKEFRQEVKQPPYTDLTIDSLLRDGKKGLKFLDEREKLTKSAAARYKEKKEVETKNGDTATVYIYSERQIANRNRDKADRVEKLRGNLDKLRSQVTKDLKSEDIKTRLTALAIGLINDTYERVGNEDSAKDGHVGVTGWTPEHVKFSQGKATFTYVGKSGVDQKKETKDANLIRVLKEAVKDKQKGDTLFTYEGGKVDASVVNEYLKPFDITAKDIRGLHANREMQERLTAIRSKGGKLPENKKEREKQLKDEFKQALEETAEAVGHEPTTLKSQYLVPGLADTYLKDGTVMKKLNKKGATAKGDCFSAAGRYFMQFRGNPQARLVHGEVAGQGPLEGVNFGHAWVEDGGMVIDTSNRHFVKMPKEAYYVLGHIDEIGNVYRYSYKQFQERVTKYKHWGPWDLKTSTGL